MREIKFRVWDKKSKTMHLPLQEAFIDDDYHGPFICIPLEAPDSIAGMQGDPPDNVLMQYTGLKDKNGVEIYEGDIIQFVRPLWEYDDNAPRKSYRTPLDHDNYLELLREADAIKDGRVIGNIYSNPELLK